MFPSWLVEGCPGQLGGLTELEEEEELRRRRRRRRKLLRCCNSPLLEHMLLWPHPQNLKMSTEGCNQGSISTKTSKIHSKQRRIPGVTPGG